MMAGARQGGGYDQLHHFVAARVWDSERRIAPLAMTQEFLSSMTRPCVSRGR
jgi:hypothetical protein